MLASLNNTLKQRTHHRILVFVVSPFSTKLQHHVIDFRFSKTTNDLVALEDGGNRFENVKQ